MSRKVSATFDSTPTASKKLPDVPIHVIDSLSVSMGLGLMVIAAARAAVAGHDAAQVIRLVEGLIPKTNVIFTVETLDCLYAGGHVGWVTVLFGTTLSIKPILCVKDGRVELLDKLCTRKRAIQRMLDLITEQVISSDPAHMAVMHCDAPADAQRLAEQVAARFHCVELLAAEAGPIIGTHTGPGTLGVAFYDE